MTTLFTNNFRTKKTVVRDNFATLVTSVRKLVEEKESKCCGFMLTATVQCAQTEQLDACKCEDCLGTRRRCLLHYYCGNTSFGPTLGMAPSRGRIKKNTYGPSLNVAGSEDIVNDIFTFACGPPKQVLVNSLRFTWKPTSNGTVWSRGWCKPHDPGPMPGITGWHLETPTRLGGNIPVAREISWR